TDRAAGRRVLDRVRDQVGQDTLERVGVGVDDRQRRLALGRDQVRRRALTEQVDRRLDGRLELHGHAAERGLEPPLDPREIQQVAHDPPQPPPPPTRPPPRATPPGAPRPPPPRAPPAPRLPAEPGGPRRRPPSPGRRARDEAPLRAPAPPAPPPPPPTPPPQRGGKPPLA